MHLYKYIGASLLFIGTFFIVSWLYLKIIH
jgi:hypothetical protein